MIVNTDIFDKQTEKSLPANPPKIRVASIFLGSFHKLSNFHGKLMKRYGKFHLEKLAVAFLDSPSASKVQYFISMKDFDTSNKFFYHDVVAGLTELLTMYVQYHQIVVSTADCQETNIAYVEINEVWKFCENVSNYQPEVGRF